MWKELPYSKTLFISCTTDDGYHIYISDYIDLWWIYYKGNEFLNQVKKSNDDLELENDEQFLQLGLKMLLYPENLKKLDINFENDALNITMLMSCGFPVCLEMTLSKGSRELFFEKVTQPLLKTIQDLKKSEYWLRHLLIKKDKEIDEYKSETDVRLAMYLKTGVFSDEEHMGKHTVYENNFGTPEVPKCLLEEAKDKKEDQVTVKQEAQQVNGTKIKDEPDSQPPIKHEPEITGSNDQNQSINSVTSKTEIKKELFISPKKKPKKLLRI